MKIQIKSIFEQIAQQVFTMKDVNQAKQFITEFVNDKGIKDEDKQLILKNISECKTMNRIHTYICNSLLKYEGMGVGKPVKETKTEPLGIQN